MSKTRSSSNALPPHPFLTHRGVSIYHVYQREMYPFKYHFAWSNTRKDGTRERAGETFDIREIHGYSDNATPAVVLPEPSDAEKSVHHAKFMWELQHRSVQRNFLAGYIEDCFAKGASPWAPFQSFAMDQNKESISDKTPEPELAIFESDAKAVLISLGASAWKDIRKKGCPFSLLIAAFDAKIRSGFCPDEQDVLCLNSDPKLLIVGRNRIQELLALKCETLTEALIVDLLKSDASTPHR